MTNRDARIVVIGAGAAGLSAAHHLFQNGFNNVIILEATDRIGGRIHTTQFGDSLIELGANWIHGIGSANSMYTLAKSKGLLMKPHVYLDRIEGQWCTEDGHIIDKRLVEKAWQIFCQVEQEIDSFFQTRKTTPVSFQQFIKNRLSMALHEFELKDRELVAAAFNCMVNYLCFHIGDDMEQISLELTGMFKEIPGGNVKIPDGFSKVMERLVKDIPNGTVKFGKRVSAIHLAKQCSKVICGNSSLTEEYIADHVVVSCSLGCLKSYHRELFQPQLPRKKIDAINKLGFGRVNKIFLYFENPFWVKGKGSVKLAWKHNSDSPEKQKWYKSIFAFDEVLNNRSVLVAWIHGTAAEHLETLSESTISKTCTHLLRTFIKNKSIPAPKEVKISTWCSSPFTLGSYSYLAESSSSTDIATLAEPLYCNSRPLICFAGEATSEQYFSTTHGARSSGIREAGRLIKYYHKMARL